MRRYPILAVLVAGLLALDAAGGGAQSQSLMPVASPPAATSSAVTPAGSPGVIGELSCQDLAGLLPIEFTEVSVSRILFRTGESEYALNGVACRKLCANGHQSCTRGGRH